MKYTVALIDHAYRKMDMYGYYDVGSPGDAIYNAVLANWNDGDDDYNEWTLTVEEGVGTRTHPNGRTKLVATPRPFHNGSTWTPNQKLKFKKQIADRETLTATVRFDDQCSNGYNSFSITGELRVKGVVETCGCVHDLIEEHFPDLAPLIKWHLCAVDGPMHYLANTIFHASDRDHWGYCPGDQRRDKGGRPMWQFNPPKVTLECCYEKSTMVGQWEPVMGEGKERELDAARASAVWPEATDKDLTADGLEARLTKRLPKLIREFKQAVTGLGMEW